MNRNQLTAVIDAALGEADCDCTAEDVEEALETINDGILSEWMEYEEGVDRAVVDIAHEDGEVVVLADISGENWGVELDRAGVEGRMRRVVRHVHTIVARRRAGSYDWGNTTPIVVVKPELEVPRPESGEDLWMTADTDYLGHPLAVAVSPRDERVVALDADAALTPTGAYVADIDDHQLDDGRVAWDQVADRDRYVRKVRHDVHVTDVDVARIDA